MMRLVSQPNARRLVAKEAMLPTPPAPPAAGSSADVDGRRERHDENGIQPPDDRKRTPESHRIGDDDSFSLGDGDEVSSFFR